MTSAIMVLILAMFTVSAAIADEKAFLETLSGSWHGGGQVRLKPGAVPLAVSCSLPGQMEQPSTLTAPAAQKSCSPAA